jgi:hypothetical protein
VKYTKAAAEKIVEALKQQGATRACALCGKGPWALADAFYFLTAQQDLPNVSVGSPGMPLAAMVCENCGNTVLINMLILGLEELTGIKPMTLLKE